MSKILEFIDAMKKNNWEPFVEDSSDNGKVLMRKHKGTGVTVRSDEARDYYIETGFTAVPF